MFAIIRTGGKQYRVEPGLEFLVEKLDVEEGSAVKLDDVLAWADGDKLEVGTPNVKFSVLCKCVSHEKGPKLMTVKYRRRNNYRRKMGHRQDYTRLLVEKFETK